MKRIMSFLVSVVVMIGVFPLGVSFAADSWLENGTYFISQGTKYVNVYANHVSDIKNNTKINMWERTKHATQMFTLEKHANGSYKILTQNSKFTMNISFLKSGASVICYADTKKNTEYFILDAIDDGYAIKPKNASTLAVTVSGSNLVLKKYTGSANQVFRFVNTSDQKEKLLQTAETVKNIIEQGEIQSPVESRIITSPFQPYYRHDYKDPNGFSHGGVDYKSKTKEENAKIYAFYEGTVYKSGYNAAGGYYIEIKHKYNGKTFYSMYMHLKKNSQLVKEGDKVSTGQQIAIMGKTGSAQTGVHLHFQITNKSTVNSDGSLHTPKNAKKYKSMTKEEQGKTKSFLSHRNVTFYNPEIVLTEGLCVIG